MAYTEAQRMPPAAVRSELSVRAGVAAGLLGGLVMGVWAMVHAASEGLGVWTPLRLIGASFVGVEALVAGAWPVLFGLLLHLLVAAAWGVMFASAFRRDASPGFALFAGLLYSVVVLVVMTFVIVPLVNPVLWARIPMISGAWLIAHMLYGIGLSFLPLIRRKLALRTQAGTTQSGTPPEAAAPGATP